METTTPCSTLHRQRYSSQSQPLGKLAAACGGHRKVGAIYPERCNGIWYARGGNVRVACQDQAQAEMRCIWWEWTGECPVPLHLQERVPEHTTKRSRRHDHEWRRTQARPRTRTRSA